MAKQKKKKRIRCRLHNGLSLVAQPIKRKDNTIAIRISVEADDGKRSQVIADVGQEEFARNSYAATVYVDGMTEEIFGIKPSEDNAIYI